MNLPALALDSPQSIYNDLMTTRRGDPIEDVLARIIASWSLGQGSMPEWLGLGEAGFLQMISRHFPGLDSREYLGLGQPMDTGRAPEMEDLRKLLIKSRTHGTQSESWMADMIVAGCLASDHLWQDMGLWQRADLSRLIFDNFRPLAIRNHRDMKWKKFLYKQLCESEGIYVCRSPSCEVCSDYHNCFGDEG